MEVRMRCGGQLVNWFLGASGIEARAATAPMMTLGLYLFAFQAVGGIAVLCIGIATKSARHAVEGGVVALAGLVLLAQWSTVNR